MASDLLSTIRSEIDARLSELRPALAEYEQLLIAADALLSADDEPAPAIPAPPVPAPKPRAPRVKRAPRGSAAGAIARAASEQPIVIPEPISEPKKPVKEKQPKAPRAARGAAREAILAALDHGSHTVGELVVVTAMSGPNLNGNLRRLVSEGAVVKTEREGKTAYALPTAA
jgi:hypothetical protein